MLRLTLPSELANVVRLCLRGPGYSVSQELAGIWISEGIVSVVFPSATSAGRNVAVYLATAAAGSVVVRNRAEVLAARRRPRMGNPGRWRFVSHLTPSASRCSSWGSSLTF